MPRCSLWVRLPQAWKQPALAAWLLRDRKLAEVLGSAEDGLWRHRSSEAAELGRPTITGRAKRWLTKRSIAWKPPLLRGSACSVFSQSQSYLSREACLSREDRPHDAAACACHFQFVAGGWLSGVFNAVGSKLGPVAAPFLIFSPPSA